MFRDLFLDSYLVFLVKLVPVSIFNSFFVLFFLFFHNLLNVHKDKKV